MTHLLRRTLLLGLLLTGFAGATRAADDAAGVRDGAGFFTAAAVRQATGEIAALRELYQVDLLIDGVASVPASKVAAVKDMTAAQRSKFFEAWAKERAQAAKLRGVIVLICKEPTHLQVEVGKQTQKKAFTLQDRTKLRDLLLARFKAKEYDQGLLDAVKFVRDRVAGNLPPPLPRVVLNEVKDPAGFFTPATVQQANTEIRELKKRYGYDIVVETIKALPEEQNQLIQGKNAAARDQVFEDWLRQRARNAGVNGVFMLICKAPPHLQVDVAPELKAKTFPEADVKRVRDLLVARFKDKEFDQGLLAALAQIQETFDRTLSPALKPLVARAVTDHGHLFNPTAVQQAAAELKNLPREPGKDVAIETFATPPPGKTKLVENMTPAERTKYFAGWAQERAGKANLDGILVLICKQPRHLTVRVNGDAASKRFPAADVDELDRLLLTRFKAKEYDKGLADAVALLRAKLAPPVVAAPPKVTAVAPKVVTPPLDTKPEPIVVTPAKTSPEPSVAKKDTGALAVVREKVQDAAQTTFPTWMWVAGIVGGLFVLFILIRILRALGSGKPAGYAETPPPRPMPQPPANVPPPAQGSYGQGPPAGYTHGPQGGYQGPPPAGPPQQGGGGGGFVTGAIGGALAGAAGTLAAKAYFDRSKGSGQGGQALPAAMPGRPAGPAAPPPVAGPSGSSAGYSAGGDFGSDDTGSASAGGDFGDTTSGSDDAAAGGGDFGSPGGDASAAAGGGGDFGSDDTASTGGGDWGGGGSSNTEGTGGDDGGGGGSSSTESSSGGDWGGGGSSGTEGSSGGDGGGGGGDSGGGSGGGSDTASTDDNKGGDF